MNINAMLVGSILAAVTASGCAATTGSHRVVAAPAMDQAPKYTDLKVTVDAKEGIPLTALDKERITGLIVKNVQAEFPGQFKTVNSEGAESAVNAVVMIKRYDEGNAIARFMLSGLGAMHIDADVAMIDLNTGNTVPNYEITKTFAWGGIYGGSTGIRDIEDGFAKAVAAAVAEKQE